MRNASAGGREDGRIDYIDGLRGIAVLAVVLDHAAQWNPGLPDQSWALFLFLRQGAHGVDLFFIISGFCLSYPTLRRYTQSGQLKLDVACYAIRRIVRIVPPFYAAIIALSGFTVILSIHGSIPEDSPLSLGGTQPAALLMQSTFLADLAHQNPVAGAFWSLFVEFRWYLIFPFALMLILKKPVFLAVTSVLLLVSLFHVTKSRDVLYLPIFMLGLCSAQYATCRSACRIPWFPTGCVLATLAYVTEPYLLLGNALAGCASFCFVNAAIVPGRWQRLLSLRPLVALGTVSYSVYLVHEPVLWEVERLLPGAPWLVSYALGSVIGVASGVAFWYIVERPFTEGRARVALTNALSFIYRRIPTTR